MSEEYIEKEAAKHIKPNPVLGEWFDHGTDYITKYQALDIVAANNITTEMTLRCYDKIVDGIYKIPAADVNPVVRCKECKHYNDGWCYNPNTYDDEKTRGNTSPDWYCANGERRE